MSGGFFGNTEETMRRIRSLKVWAIMGVVAAIAIVGLLTAESLSTTGPTTKQPAAEFAPAKAEFEETRYDISPSPVIEPNPRFFYGAGDGSNGSYNEPQRR